MDKKKIVEALKKERDCAISITRFRNENLETIKVFRNGETDGIACAIALIEQWQDEPITAEALQVEGWERQEGRNDTSYFYLPNVSHTGLKVYFKGNSIEGVYVGGVHFFGVTGMNGLKDATILVYGDF